MESQNIVDVPVPKFHANEFKIWNTITNGKHDSTAETPIRHCISKK